MRKIFRTVASAIVAFAAIGGLSACADEGTECQHKWDEGEVTVEATCTQDGEMTYTCTECGEERTEDIPMLGHDFTGAWVNTDANGHYHICTRCDATDTLVAHTMVDGDVITPATEEQEGTQQIICSVCGYESIKILPVLTAHSAATEWKYDDAYHWHECAAHEDCDVTFDYGQHEYATELTDQRVPATCKDDGHSVWACVCGKTEQRVIPKDESLHQWDEGEVTVEATCEHAGEMTYTCSVCGGTRTEEIPALEHDFTGAWVNTDPEGHYHKCENCGATDEKVAHSLVIKQDAEADKHYGECSVCGYRTELADHVWGEGVVTRPATLYAEGERTYTCECGKTRTEAIPAGADFAADFTIENQDGAWSYGAAAITNWDANNFAFEFTPATEKNTDTWLINGAEIKAGWINAAGTIAVSYKVERDIIAQISLAFNGSSATSRVSLRLAVIRDDAVAGTVQFAYDENKNTASLGNLISLKAGDVIYVIVNNEGDAVDAMGSLDISLAPADAEQQKHSAGEVWAYDGENHWKVCSAHLYCTEKPDMAEHSLQFVSADENNHKGTCECGFEVTEEHEWDEGVVTAEATCDKPGEITYTCTVCGEEKVEAGDPATGHSFDDVWHFVSGDTAYHYHQCTVCGAYDEQTKESHVWEETGRTEATPEANGKITYTCTVCGGEKEEELYYIEHQPETEWSYDDTYHWHACAVHEDCAEQFDKAEHSLQFSYADEDNHTAVCECGYEITQPHQWDEGEVTVEATCEHAGEMTYTCSVCGGTKTEEIPALEHDFTGAWVNTDPEGHYHKCENCGATDEKVAHSLVIKQDAEADKHYGECSVCGYRTELADHVWGEGVVTRPATLYAEGERTYTCECGKTRTEAIPAGADFAADFTIENQDGAWSYGAAAINNWDGNNFAFEFTPATEKNADTWLINGAEIKAGWVNAAGMVAISYKAESDIIAEVSLAFNGSSATSRASLRLAVVGANGSQCMPVQFIYNEGSPDSSVNYTIAIPAGGRVFVFINKESQGDNGMGNLTIHLAPAAVSAEFGKEFSADNQDGAWSYGKVDYKWGAPEDFTFIQATEKNESGDGWQSGSVQITSDYVSFGEMAAIGYTAESDMTFTAYIIVRGSTDETRADLRVGVKDAQGAIISGPDFRNNTVGNVLCVSMQVTLKAGDTVYFILSNGNGGNAEAVPDGGIYIGFTQTAA